MPSGRRETRLVQTFVELADTLVNDFDVVEFLHLLVRRTLEGFDAAEAGILLARPDGTLHLMASSSERTRSLELFQLQNEEGPCLECFTTGEPLTIENLDDEVDRWPRFVPAARAAGFASVHAVPMRLRDERIGVLNVFGAQPGPLTEGQALVSRAMADIATIGILQQRAIHEAQVSMEQLQVALTSRVMIEQAKGVLAERAGLAMEESFELLRAYARATNRRLSDVAQDLLEGKLTADALQGL
jgi:GAF domain-containing protein